MSGEFFFWFLVGGLKARDKEIIEGVSRAGREEEELGEDITGGGSGTARLRWS